MAKISEKLNKLPNKPGVYLFYNNAKELIYVGKATSLKNRIKSYFHGFVIPTEVEGSLKHEKLTSRDSSLPRTDRNNNGSRPIENNLNEIADIKFEVTDSVLEAVILESIYIKKYQPKYNVMGKDNKSWNYLALTKDDFPKLVAVRQHEISPVIASEFNNERRDPVEIATSATPPRNDKYKYLFGPFPGLKTSEALKILKKLFNVSSCEPSQGKECFYRQLNQCLGVCTGEISKTEYNEKVIRPLKMFLRGQKKRLITGLKKEMRVVSKDHNFEEAARLRDQMNNLQKIHDVSLLNKEFFKNQLSNVNSQLSNVRVEAYDISNLGDSGMVGSMVVFNASGPVKSEYKKFKIRTVSGQSDVDCLEEVLERRLKHDDWARPDLILVDGGKPQVNVIKKLMASVGARHGVFWKSIPIIGIAKGTRRKKNEFIYDGANKKTAQLIKDNEQLLIQARDEAHRFAISYQRKLREIKK